MEKSNQMIEDKKSKLERARELHDSAKDREFTKDERQEFDSLMDEIEDLNIRIKKSDSKRKLVIINGSNPEAWRKHKGEAITIYDKDSDMTISNKVTLGSFLRAMLLGATNEAEERALSEGSDSAGGYTVTDYLSSMFIDKLRTKTRVIQAGAKIISLNSDSHKFAKVLTDPTAAWRAENALISDSSPTFTQVEFAPETLAALVRVSRELLQDSVNIESLLTHMLTKAMGEKIDYAALLGSGTSNEPQGITNYSNLSTTVSMGTNGLGFSGNYDRILDAVNNLLTNNVNLPTAMICHPRTLINLAKMCDGNNQPLEKPDLIKDIPILDTTAIPVNQTQGTSTDCSTMFVGDFSDLVIGVRSDIRIEVLKERYMDYNQYAFVCTARVDVKPLHEQSFTKIYGIRPYGL